MGKWWGDIYQGYRDIEKNDVVCYIHGAEPKDIEPWETERKEYIIRYRSLIGRNLASMREELNLSYRDLADKSHVSSATILRYEKGVVFPKYDSLEKLIDAFKDLGLMVQGREVQFSDLLTDDHADLERYDDIYLSPVERDILESVNMLNGKGRQVAKERVNELTKISDYTEEDV